MKEDNELMTVVKQTAFNVASISEQMGILNNAVKELKLEQIKQAEQFESFRSRTEDRMQSYEDKLPVTRMQAQNLRNSIHARAALLLDIHYKDGIIEDEIGLYNDKYYRGGFISRLYSDARKQSRLGTPYYATYARDVEEVLDFINEWIPPAGVEGFKRYLDARRRK